MVAEQIRNFLLSLNNPYCADLAEIYNKFGECDDALRKLYNDGRIDILSTRQKSFFVKLSLQWDRKEGAFYVVP